MFRDLLMYSPAVRAERRENLAGPSLPLHLSDSFPMRFFFSLRIAGGVCVCVISCPGARRMELAFLSFLLDLFDSKDDR